MLLSNRDTVKYFLKIARNGELKDYLIYPNPSKFSTFSQVLFAFPRKQSILYNFVYNSFGQLIRSSVLILQLVRTSSSSTTLTIKVICCPTVFISIQLLAITRFLRTCLW
jgi:hypothetical protein